VIDAQTYLEHVRRDGHRIAQAAAGHLDVTVPSCPDYTVGSLLVHTAGVCWFWVEALIKGGFPGRPQRPEGDTDPLRMDTDPVRLHTEQLERVLDELPKHDPDDATWTWFPPEQRVGFWYRRAAQELSIHRWDVENAVGDPLPIDPTLAVDGTDEFLAVFSPASPMRGASERFDGDGEVLRFEATDVPASWNLVARPDRFEDDDSATPDVVGRATASDVNLFVWGRIGPDALKIEGDRSLLDRWHDRVKI
jgi:uncharacterized protein (TIGR03083 family)